MASPKVYDGIPPKTRRTDPFIGSEDYQVVTDTGNQWLAVIEPEREYSLETECSN